MPGRATFPQEPPKRVSGAGVTSGGFAGPARCPLQGFEVCPSCPDETCRGAVLCNALV